eukprot:COSAG04_NODE_59_length_30260_cov_18.181327_13_plen_205_part_00
MRWAPLPTRSQRGAREGEEGNEAAAAAARRLAFCRARLTRFFSFASWLPDCGPPWTGEGSLTFGSPVFSVTSGPCTVSEGGRCVGRPEGYGPNEACAITVGGTGGGVLGPCAVFDTTDSSDYVTLLGGAQHGDSGCPVGAALAPGDALSWTSNGVDQGTVGRSNNGCAAKGTCGAPYTAYGPGGTRTFQDFPNGLGGGWQLCFA